MRATRWWPGITGAAAARPGGLSNVQGDTWFRVVLGLVVSVILGFLLGRLCGFPAVRDSRRSPAFYRGAQTGGAAAMAFFHGAQDGQKFMGVFLLGVALAQGRRDTETFLVPMWLMVLCALTMALGTSLGGKRIIDTVAMKWCAWTPPWICRRLRRSTLSAAVYALRSPRLHHPYQDLQPCWASAVPSPAILLTGRLPAPSSLPGCSPFPAVA